MLRKFVFSSMAAAGLITPMAATSQANAADISLHFGTRGYHGGYRSYSPYPSYQQHHHHHAHYRVFYRSCAHEPWAMYGTYHDHGRAHQVEHRLEARGYDAYVSHR